MKERLTRRKGGGMERGKSNLHVGETERGKEEEKRRERAKKTNGGRFYPRQHLMFSQSYCPLCR